MTHDGTSDNGRYEMDALLQLHLRVDDRFNKRRDLEWKLTLTLWGGILLAANVVRSLDRSGWVQVVTIVGGVFVVAAHLFWEEKYVAPSAERDRDDGVALDRLIRGLLQDKLGREIPRSAVGDYNKLAAHRWQVGMTILLGGVLVLAAFFG